MTHGEILRREARILRGHYGEGWKQVIENLSATNKIDAVQSRRLAMLQVIEPVIGYSLQATTTDQEDKAQLRRYD